MLNLSEEKALIRSLQKPNARLVPNLGQMELCTCARGNCLLPSEKTRMSTKEKFDLLSKPYFVIQKGSFAVHDMERLLNNVNIIWQKCPCEKRKATISSLFLKDFRNRTHMANRKLQLGRKRRVDTWTKSQVKTNVRKQVEVGSQRPGTCLTDGRKGRRLGGSERHQELATAR